MNALRTFVAIDLSLECRSAIGKAIRKLSSNVEGVKWVQAEQLHLTLHFLGDVTFTDVKSVCDAVQAAAAKIEPFQIRLQGLGGFPNLERPRVIWVGVVGGHPELVELQRRLKEPLGDMGYPSDKNTFKPHITIGRVKRVRDTQELAVAAEPFLQADFGTSVVDELVVYQSELQRSGPKYTPISEIELG